MWLKACAGSGDMVSPRILIIRAGLYFLHSFAYEQEHFADTHFRPHTSLSLVPDYEVMFSNIVLKCICLGNNL